MIEALIFDVDGTLAETEECHRRAFNETFAEFGLDWHWDRPLYRRLLETTGGKERMTHYLAMQRQGDAVACAVATRIPEIHEAKTRRYTALIASGAAALRPGIARTLASAVEAGVKLGIATTTSPANVEALLEATLGKGAMDYFDAVAAGDSVSRKKPAPDVYKKALDDLGVQPSACVALEDSWNGLAAAQGAAIATVVTPSLYTDDQDFSGALAVLSDLGEPERPYRHLSGAGADEGCVTLAALGRWVARGKGRKRFGPGARTTRAPSAGRSV